MVRFSLDCCAFRWQFNQYRHTLSVFLSGACVADSGIAGVGGDGYGGGGGAVVVVVVVVVWWWCGGGGDEMIVSSTSLWDCRSSHHP